MSAALLAACSDSTQPTPTYPVSPQVVVVGRTERGLTVRVRVVRGGDSTDAIAAAISLSPAGAASVVSDGSILLTRAGALTVSVKLFDTTASTSFTIAAPPTILFDMSVAGNRDIYRVSLDGNDLERLTTDPVDDVHATMAHGRVVFTSYRDGNAELYLVGAGPSGADLRLTTTATDHPLTHSRKGSRHTI